MSLIRSILVLATVVSTVLVPLFAGHALASHANVWFVYGGVMLMLAMLAGRGWG